MIPSRNLSFGLLLAVAMAGVPRLASAVDITPSIEVGEIYTNNVNLQPAGLEEDEWVTRVAPRLRVAYAGPSLALDVDYTLESLFYARDSSRNEIYNQLESSALLDVLGKALQLAGDAEVRQVNLTPERAVASTNINSTMNRGDRTVVSGGPRWSKDVFGASRIDGYATAARINYSGIDTQDVNAVYGRFALHSDPTLWRSVTSYELAYEYHRFDYEISDTATVQTAYLQLGYAITDGLELLGLAGLDSDIENLKDSSLSKGRWEAGMRASSGSSVLRASIGKRYFGTTYAFNWENIQPDAAYRVGYTEMPVTTELSSLEQMRTPAVPPVGQAGQVGIPSDSSLPPDSSLDRQGSPIRYVLKRGNASADWRLFRTAVRVALFWEDRQNQVMPGLAAGSGLSLSDEQAYGGVLRFQWEPGMRSMLALSGGWTHREVNDLAGSGCVPGGSASCSVPRYSDQLKNVQLEFNYNLGLRTSVRTGLGWLSRTGSLLPDYDELFARVQLAHTF